MVNSLKTIGVWISKVWSRTRLFTYEEWCGLIDKVHEKKGKKIKTKNMEVILEYEHWEEKK